MKKLQTCIFLLLTQFCCNHLIAQNRPIKYSFSFDFQDGLYQTFDEFKSNNPSILEYHIVTQNGAYLDVFRDKVSVKRIEYINPVGLQSSLKRNEVWGCCIDGIPYILINGSFQKILKIGSLTYFIALLDPEYQTASPSQGYGSVSGTSSVRCLLDFENGEILAYSYKDFLSILERDPELFNEYNSISSKKKRKQMMIRYIDKYNKRNPIYFPELD